MKNINSIFSREIWTPRSLDNHLCAVLDLDGCIADNAHRKHLFDNYPQAFDKNHKTAAEVKAASDFWTRYHKDVELDGFAKHIFDMYQYLCGKYPTIRRVIITGRNEANRVATSRWLLKHNVDIDEFYMRKEGDHRPAQIVKLEIIARLKEEGLKTIFCFEDEPRICQAFTLAGIHTYQITLPSKIEVYQLQEELVNADNC